MSNTSDESTIMSLNERKLRPSERVAQYLLNEFERKDLKEGSRLPSNRELAKRLNVSVPTVQGVIKKLSKEGRIQARHGSGTYLVSSPTAPTGALRFAVAAMLTKHAKQDSMLVNDVVSGFMPLALESPRPITFVGIAPEKYGTDDSVPALIDERDRVNGLIILPYSLMPNDLDRITTAYESAGKPVVQLFPPVAGATHNYVAFDCLKTGRTVGEAFAATGRKRIALYAAYQPYQFSTITQTRLMGLAIGVGERLGRDISIKVYALNEDPNLGDHDEFLADLDDHTLPPPDAIWVVNEAALSPVLEKLKARGLRIPRDVSIITSCWGTTPLPFITTIHEPVSVFSREILEMLNERIENNGASVPGRLIPAKFDGGSTTRPEENRLLGIS